MTKRPWLTAAIGVSAVASGIGTVAEAQQQGVRGAVLEELVVTARKREESLAEVPLSISVFTSAFIERAGINSVTELAKQTPGFTLHHGFGRSGAGQGGGSSNRPVMRGQSNILGVPNVGYFVDGIYVSGNITSYQLDNLERVEVIRGPQSALFGRGTFAGAVNFITRRPGDVPEGKIEATAASFDRYKVTGFLSGPIIENLLAGEINGRWYDFGGDYVNRATGRREGGAESSENVGGKLYFTPNDDLSFEFNIGWSRDVDGHYAASYSGVNCLLPDIIEAGPPPRSSNRRIGYYCGEVGIEDSFVARTDIISQAGLSGVDRTTLRSSLRADYDMGDWSLSGVAALNRFRNQNASDRAFTQGEPRQRPGGLIAAEDRRKDWSLELRLSSPVDQRARGLVGAYYYREDDGEGYRVNFILPPGPIPVGTPINFTRIDERNDSGVRNWSVFGMLEYDVTENLAVTAEGRYQVDRIISDQLVLVPDNPLLSNDFKKFLPRFTFLYNLTENWNLYGNVAKGNKPGGFNSLPDDASPESAAALARFQVFEEESAWTYEAGFKGFALDRRVSADIALFWINWDDQQLTRTESYFRVDGSTFARSLIQNAGSSRIRGIELDLNARVTDWLDLRLGYAYTDARITNFVDEVQEDLFDTDGLVGNLNPGNDPDGQTKGNRLPQQPLHQLILSGEINRDLNADWTLFTRLDGVYESKRYAQVHNLAHGGDSFLLNARLGAETGNWTVTVFVDNLLNDDTPPVVSRFVDFFQTIRIPDRLNPAATQTVLRRDMLAAHPRKRSYGVTVSYRF